jgi:hypothetical protein
MALKFTENEGPHGMKIINSEPVDGNDIPGLIEKLHDLSMDSNMPPEVRAQSRLMKAILPATLQWFRDEHGRGSNFQDVIAAFESAVTNVIVNAAEAIAPTHAASTVMRILAVKVLSLVEAQATLVDAQRQAESATKQ